MIAFLTIIYTAIVVLLFKLKLIKPRPVPIGCCVVAGILILGPVVVAWG
jgi:membrane fusion protein, multidrug efflux system